MGYKLNLEQNRLPNLKGIAFQTRGGTGQGRYSESGERPSESSFSHLRGKHYAPVLNVGRKAALEIRFPPPLHFVTLLSPRLSDSRAQLRRAPRTSCLSAD